MPRVSVVILNYRNAEDTLACLSSLMQSDAAGERIVVVDGASGDGSPDAIADWFGKRGLPLLRLAERENEDLGRTGRRFFLLEARSNRGYAAGNNIGIRRALKEGDELVLVLNNDTLVDKDFLRPLTDFLDAHGNAAMAGPLVSRPDGSHDKSCARRRPTLRRYLIRNLKLTRIPPFSRYYRRQFYLDEFPFRHPMRVDILSGSCFLIRSRVLERIGLLDENTFLYYEEPILGEQMRMLGLETYLVPESRIVHLGAQSTRSSQGLARMHRAMVESGTHYLGHYRHWSRWRIWLSLAYSRSRIAWLAFGGALKAVAGGRKK